MTRLVGLLLTLLAAAAPAAEFRAGTARLDITPDGPIWLSGYASRSKPSEGVLHPLFVRALALEDGEGNRLVVASADLIGFPRELSDEVCARVAKQYGLARSQVLLNASHTHTGPIVWSNLRTMYDLPPEEVEKLKMYSRRVADSLVNVIGTALGRLAPASMALGEGSAGFAANRRVIRPDGKVDFGVNPAGPVDHAVPVIRVTGEAGQTLAIVFGYACHNTTLTGEHYQVSGDYSGFAASTLEETFPGATALFLALCGGDQNPNPRSEVDLVRRHGAALADEVRRVAQGELTPIRPPIRSAFQIVDLRFRHHTREQYEKELESKDAATVRRARKMLDAYEERRPIRSVPYPVQAIRFGGSVTVLALGGEVVVDYALRAKREFAGERLIVAGYSNDVMCYIPSVRVLREGGYEADRSMVYYGQPGPFAEDVEEVIFETAHKVMRRVGVRGAARAAR